MPWELGDLDGICGKIPVCPKPKDSSFRVREYFGLCPEMESDFWLHKDGSPL